MLKRTTLIALLFTLVCASSLAAPPDRTYVVAQGRTASGVLGVEFVELNPSTGSAKVLATDIVSHGAMIQTAIIDANPSSPMLVGLTRTGTLYFIQNQGGQTYSQTSSTQGYSALCENDGKGVLVSDHLNAIQSADSQGMMTTIVPQSVIPKTAYTGIRKMQVISPGRIAVLTDSHLLVVDITGPSPTLTTSVDLTKIRSNIGNLKFAFDMVAVSDAAWIMGYMDPPFGGSIMHQPILLDLKSGTVKSTGIAQSPQPPFNELLDMDPTTHELRFTRGDYYYKADASGAERIDARDAFLAEAQKAAGQHPVLGHITLSSHSQRLDVVVNHHKTVHTWLSRANGAQNVSPVLVPQPQAPLQAQAQTVPGPPLPAPAAEPTSGTKAGSKIIDHVTATDFLALMRDELNGARVDTVIRAELFAELVGQTNALKYYFQTLEPEELARFGLKRQGYWLRALKGHEQDAISISAMADLLAQGRVREIRLKTCEEKLLP